MRALRICLINPRFEPSLYAFNYTIPLMGIDCWSAPGGLPLLAALVPEPHRVTLVDENVEAIDWEALRHFDIIGLTGMVVQRDRMVAILETLRTFDATVVLGGPFVTVAEEQFAGLCDVKFIGEAETTWPAFLSAFAANAPYESRYEQRERTDMSTVPVPRYDLLHLRRYGLVPVQFSRGCPFQCEFCDIITIFGRKPRVKTPEQFIAELDLLVTAGVRTVFVVDDNFYGNRRAAKALLERLVPWQRERNFPLRFATEASVNIADDPEFMALMLQANFRQIFMGLESPRPESLSETRKFQNTRGDSLVAKVARVRDAGFVITAGFIVGFDHDDERIFDEQYDFITESGIAQAHVAILTPIPTTPLFDRLEAQGRLDPSNRDVPFVPAGMSQATLRAGHLRLGLRLYEPRAYLTRVFRGYESSSAFRERRSEMDARTGGGLFERVRKYAGAALLAARFANVLRKESHLRRLVPSYVSMYVRHAARMGVRSIPIDQYVSVCAFHWHFYKIVRSHMRFDFGNAQAPMASSSASELVAG